MLGGPDLLNLLTFYVSSGPLEHEGVTDGDMN